MARRRRRYYKHKGRWSANIKNINSSINTIANSSFYGFITLCENPAQNDSTVSQQYTVKNVEYNYKISSTNASDLENIQTYIMFVPQGYTITETLPFTHPEWIMAYKYLGGPDASTEYYRLPQKIKTRLSRRLQTGDRIIYMVVGNNDSGNNVQITNRGIIRWWTKAN